MPIVEVNAAQPPFVLALDIGTSSTRSLLFDSRGHTLRDSESQLGFEMTVTADGGAEVDAGALLDLVGQSIDQVLSRFDLPISAVGISCFWHSLLGLDHTGRPTTPVYLWADTRSRMDIDQIRREFDPDELWQRTGCFVHSSYWPGKLRWMHRVEPELSRSTATWCAFSDYLARELFGAAGTTVSMASSTAMLNATSQRWDELAIAAANIDPGALPEIIDQTQPLTGLRRAFGSRWPALALCPWFPGIGDGACANVGSGGVGPNRIALTVGTSGAVRLVKRLPVGQSPDAPGALWTYRLDSARAVVGAAISNGGKVIDWLTDLTHTSFEGEALASAEAMEPDNHGLTFLPFLAGERAPLWSDWVSGSLTGLRLATTPADLLRAGMEAVSYRLALLYRDLATQADPDHAIIANGGAVLRSEAWLQMLADVLQHPIVALPPDEESSARGAALMALEYAGLIKSIADVDDPVLSGTLIEPNPANAAIYAAAMARQEKLLDLLNQNGRPRLDN